MPSIQCQTLVSECESSHVDGMVTCVSEHMLHAPLDLRTTIAAHETQLPFLSSSLMMFGKGDAGRGSFFDRQRFDLREDQAVLEETFDVRIFLRVRYAAVIFLANNAIDASLIDPTNSRCPKPDRKRL